MVTVYCSGSIQKGASDAKKLCWTDRERRELAEAALPIEVQFLNPDDPFEDLGDNLAVFGRDMYQVGVADVVVVDGRERRGIGIGIEMLASRFLGSLLVAVVPRNTYYRMDHVEYRGATVSDYVHPHLAILADAVVDDFVSAGRWIAENMKTPPESKKIDTLIASIAAYKKSLLPKDEPMQRILDRLGPDRHLRF